MDRYEKQPWQAPTRPLHHLTVHASNPSSRNYIVQLGQYRRKNHPLNLLMWTAPFAHTLASNLTRAYLLRPSPEKTSACQCHLLDNPNVPLTSNRLWWPKNRGWVAALQCLCSMVLDHSQRHLGNAIARNKVQRRSRQYLGWRNHSCC